MQKIAEVRVIDQSVAQYSYEDLVDAGLQIREVSDRSRWKLGDIAIEVTKITDTDGLKQYARDIGVTYSSLRRYRDVSKHYPQRDRDAYQMLSWTHFRTVATHEDRDKLLERAHDENWSVEKLRVMSKEDQTDVIDDGKVVPNKPKLEFCTGCRKWFIENEDEDCKSRGNCYDD